MNVSKFLLLVEKLTKAGWVLFTMWHTGCENFQVLAKPGRKPILITLHAADDKITVRQRDKADCGTCKWCGSPDGHRGTNECDRCWELRHRIEADTGLAREMVEKIMEGAAKIK